MKPCEWCQKPFTSPTGKARFCGFDCQTAYSLKIRKAKNETLASLPTTIEKVSVVVTPATIERDFPGVFLLEWAQ